MRKQCLFGVVRLSLHSKRPEIQAKTGESTLRELAFLKILKILNDAVRVKNPRTVWAAVK